MYRSMHVGVPTREANCICVLTSCLHGSSISPTICGHDVSSTPSNSPPCIVDDPTSSRPPAEQRHPSALTTTSARPPAERRHPASATSRAAAPSHHRRPFQLGHRRGDGTIVAGTAHPSPASTDDDHTAVETPKCSSATRPVLHVQARHPAPTRRRHHCEDTEVQPDDEAGASSSSPAPTRRRRRRRTPPGRPPRRAAWSRRADLQLGTRARARTHVRACIAR
jgi:hypothetical protein